MKQCCVCKQAKDLSSFSKNRARYDGLQTECRECKNAASRRRHAENPEIGRAYTKKFHQKNPDFSWACTMRRKYGLSTYQFFELLKAQEYSCAICFSKAPGGRGRFHVDHDHATGQIRGLLCHRCNTILGHAKDNPDTLLRAATYLGKNSQEVADRLAALQEWVDTNLVKRQ